MNGLVNQDTQINYDAQNRIATLADIGYTDAYTYDLAGNRTHIYATYFDYSGVQQVSNLYYTYDAMNRVLVSQGVLTNGIVQIASNQGVYLQYNLAGERSSASQYDGQVLTLQGSTLTYTSGLDKTTYNYETMETWCRLTGRSLVCKGALRSRRPAPTTKRPAS